MSAEKNRKLILATAVAALFAGGAAMAEEAPATEAKVHCGGVNACKGTSDCATANNACAGQNACKGQGFTDMTKAECDAAGGKPMEAAM
jgi:hypothetical protein